MNVEDFKQLLDERKSSHPIWFELPSPAVFRERLR